jgi:protein SCO1/2
VRTTVVLCIAFVGLVLGLFWYSMSRPDHPDLEALSSRGVFVLPRPRELSPFELRDEEGEPFTRDDLEGQWQFVFFGFTHCPDICPVTMSVLAQAERKLMEAGETPFRGVLVTVDPERDDQQTLADYVHAFSDSFVGVRGDPAVLASFATELHAAFAPVPTDDGDYTVDHTGNIVVLNPKGHYHGFIKMPHDTDTIVDAYLAMRAEF